LLQNLSGRRRCVKAAQLAAPYRLFSHRIDIH
jgi:hypothetical protein